MGLGCACQRCEVGGLENSCEAIFDGDAPQECLLEVYKLCRLWFLAGCLQGLYAQLDSDLVLFLTNLGSTQKIKNLLYHVPTHCVHLLK